MLEAHHVIGGWMRREIRNILTSKTGADARDTLGVFVGRLWVESYAFEMLAALVACEALGVETRPASGNDAASNGESTLLTECAGADCRWSPVSTRSRSAIVAVGLGHMVSRCG